MNQSIVNVDKKVLKIKQEYVVDTGITTQKLENKIINLKNQLVETDFNMSRKLENHIKNCTFVTGELHQAISDSHLDLSKKLELLENKLSTKLTNIIINMTKKYDDEILNLRRDFEADTMKSKNLSEEIKIIKKENRLA